MFRAMLEAYKGRVPIVGLLTDTYDHEHCIRNILGKELKEVIQNFPGLVERVPTPETPSKCRRRLLSG